MSLANPATREIKVIEEKLNTDLSNLSDKWLSSFNISKLSVAPSHGPQWRGYYVGFVVSPKPQSSHHNRLRH
jgi:hypothetical protein